MKNVWIQFIQWKGWTVCKRGWLAFVHWSGWKAFGRWKIWHLHPALTLLLAFLAGTALVWVFATGGELRWYAYPTYALSAYALTLLCLRIPGLVWWMKREVLTHRLIRPLVESEEKRFLLDLFREQIINFGYGTFKTISGIVLAVPWIWADGLYNLVQGIIQISQITLHRKHLPVREQWRSYRVTGWMILAVHLTMTGLVFMMIHRGQAEEYPGYMIFATAAFTFYKLISAFIDVVKDRKHRSPVDSGVHLLDLTQALFSLFSLQVALLHAFGDGTVDTTLLNSLTGGAVCLLVMFTGIYMIRRANRVLKE